MHSLFLIKDLCRQFWVRLGRSRKIVVPSFIDFTVIIVIFGLI
jgi:hypothetical protein